MKKIYQYFVAAITFTSFTIHLQAEPISLFDGKTLNGWTGDNTFWKIEDGAITGECTAENPCKRTTYLAYNKKEFSNFELTVSFRFMSESGNSGIQYRSQWKNKSQFQIKGYQADMETGKKYNGILYEQDGRRILAKRGEHVTISKAGEKSVVLTLQDSAEKAQNSVQLKQWNTYRIIANGHTITHEINGHKTIRVDDNDNLKFSPKGLIALQLHKGPAMKIQFKDIFLTELKNPQ